jgi:hypothetical protein
MLAMQCSISMKRITNDGLENLGEQRVCVPSKEIAQCSGALLGCLKAARGNARAATGNLCDCFGK